ncbi:hypothetical protein [Paenibacillus assamensis]|nr:hypothetical protein [Paenibacillus assamensis]
MATVSAVILLIRYVVKGVSIVLVQGSRNGWCGCGNYAASS